MKNITLTAGKQSINVFVNEQDGEQWVAIKPLCEVLGLQHARQYQKLKGNPQFRVYTYVYTSNGGNQETLCVPVTQIGMWICNINARKVKPEIRGKILDCQMHLQIAIHDHLTGRITAETVQKLADALWKIEHELKLTRKELAEERTKRQALERIVQKELGIHARFEKADASAGGATLAARRWATRDRDTLN